LGFDPAPGDAGSADAVAGKLGRILHPLGQTHQRLVGIRDNHEVWTGKAAEAFASHLDELPKHLGDAHTCLSNVRHEVSGWGQRLSGYQNRAQGLEQQAKTARAELEHAEAEENQAKADYPYHLNGRVFPTQAEADAATTQLQTAGQRIENAVTAHRQAHGNLHEIIQQGMTLQDEHNTDGDATARRIGTQVEELAPPGPSLLDRFEGWAGDAWHTVEGWASDAGNWVKDHLQDIGDIAGMISAISGALSLIPVLAPITGPIAIASGAVALAAHGTKIGMDVHKTGHFTAGEGFELAGDLVGVVPGIGAVKGGLKGAVEGVDEAGRGLESVSRLGRFGEGAAKNIKSMVGDPTDLAKKFGGVVTHSAPDEAAANVAARVSEGAFDVGTQVPGAVGMATGQDHVPGQHAASGAGTLYGAYGGISGLRALAGAGG
jgi:hypothetical protein